MKLLGALRNRRSRDSRRGREATPDPPDGPQLPIRGYDRLGAKEIADKLSGLRQVDLAAIDAYERAHDARPVVLDKLRYMRGSEPLVGYDALAPEQIATALAGADAQTVKAVRDYERKFQRRRSVLEETARVLPRSTSSAREKRAQDEKAARLREGFADRERRARDLSG
jgi:hypothetical protein